MPLCLSWLDRKRTNTVIYLPLLGGGIDRLRSIFKILHEGGGSGPIAGGQGDNRDRRHTGRTTITRGVDGTFHDGLPFSTGLDVPSILYSASAVRSLFWRA